MALSDIVNVSISTNTVTPTRVGFGTIMIAGYHTLNTDRVRSYSNLAAMVADGFSSAAGTASNGIYQAAAKAFSQNPAITRVKIGRRSSAFTQVAVITPKSTVQGVIYTLTVVSSFGTTVVSYTVPGAATATSISTALAALINANTQVTAVATTVVTITTNTAGILVEYKGRNPEMWFQETTVDPGIAADLALIYAADSDFYGVALDSNGAAEIAAAAAWVESNNKIMVVNSSDTFCTDGPTTTDIASTLKTSNYFRTACIYNGSSNLSYTGVAWLAHEFPFDPGTRTYCYKTLAAVSTDVISDTQEQTLYTKNCNSYRAILGVAVTQKGKVAAGEYLDVMIGRDWLQQRMKERVYGLLIANGKIPYTDSGIAKIETEIRAQLTQAVNVGFLSPDVAFTVIVPAIANVSAADKASRTLNNVTFSANLAGAIHAVTITGTVSL